MVGTAVDATRPNSVVRMTAACVYLIAEGCGPCAKGLKTTVRKARAMCLLRFFRRRGSLAMADRVTAISPLASAIGIHDQSHQFGERIDIHLLHDLLPAQFHGSQSDVELRGDVLVHLAFDKQLEDIPFTGS